MKRHGKGFKWATVAAALLLAVSGCSADTTDGNDSDSDVQKVKVGYFPLAHTSTAVNADESGIFNDEGLDVELVATEGGAQAIPLLVSGEIDFVYSNYTSALLAAEKGLDVKIVSGNDVGVNDHGVYVSKDSGISSLSDLAGKKVAVNNLQNIGTVAVYAHLEEAGKDPKEVNLVEMPYPDMAAAISRGSVDAGWQVEPFQAFAEAAGLKKVDNLFSGPVADMPVAGWLTTGKFADENPEAVKKFQAAIAKSAEDLSSDDEKLKKTITSFTKIDEQTIENMQLPVFQSEINVEKLKQTEELMRKYGITSSELKIDDLAIIGE